LLLPQPESISTPPAPSLSPSRRVVLAWCPALLCELAGCRSKNLAGRTEEEKPRLASVLMVAQPQALPQLVSGWYEGLPNEWRWTAKRFSAVLGTPRGAARNGAVLKLKFYLTDPLIAQLKSVTLAASVNGAIFEPQTYTRAGDDEYTHDVPASLFPEDKVQVEFWVKKPFIPGKDDMRELGVVVRRLALEPK